MIRSNAVIGWAGVLGETFIANNERDAETVWDYCESLPDDLSPTDMDAINGHTMKRRAFDTAARIIG